MLNMIVILLLVYLLIGSFVYTVEIFVYTVEYLLIKLQWGYIYHVKIPAHSKLLKLILSLTFNPNLAGFFRGFEVGGW